MQPLSLAPDGQGSPAEDKSFVEIVCPRTVVFRGIGQDVEPARLTGTVVVHLAEPAALRDITLEFTGKAKLPAPPSPHIKSQNGYTVYTHEQSFMPMADKKQSHTFKAGRHAFPFEVDLEPYLPSSLCVSRAHITYKLRATAVRPSLVPNFTCTVPIDVVRSFGPNSLEYQQTLEVENTWPGKLMYSLTLPHKAWAAGDTVVALVKFQPLAKGVSVSVVCSMITESVKYAGLSSVELKKDVCSARHIFYPSANSRRTSTADSQSSSHPHSSREVPTGNSFGEQSSSHQRQGGAPANGISVDLAAFEDQEGDEEIVGKVELKIPRWACPSHSVAPISVVHRIRWVIVIRNPDGHFSELRCSLPIHILSYHVLDEAVQASAPTRRLLFGIDDLVLPDSEQVELPTYDAHVMDPVPNALDGWSIDVGPFTTGTAISSTTSPDGYFAILQPVRGSVSNPSTPGHHGRSLPEDAEFLPATISALAASALNSTPISLPPTQSSSASNSRPSSRPSTRPPTPETGSSAPSSSSHTLDHPQSLPAPMPSRKPLFSLGGMKPLTAFSSRAASSSRGPSRPTTPPHPPPVPFDRALQAALSAVPDYDTASRGFALGGVPPLSSTAGLPSYDEAQRSLSDSDLASRARAGTRHVSFADADSPAHGQSGIRSNGSAPVSSHSSSDSEQ
ncbi:hypothetical protein AURDEDRAFT_111349 [Auricularia subglabra TFB-10046 SS5]|nr:hypothetical protein AURDEDRAFT_111349 [Auricularia subglabra TFB-10046 SS5]